jgi:uncharacterized protein (TIGR03083 family)
MDRAWRELQGSIEGLSEQELTEPGTLDEWSVRDILGHITTWEEEALAHLPLIMAGGRPPRYASQGGIDGFNARMTKKKRELPLAEVKRQMNETHERLIRFIREAPADQFGQETRARRRLRLDTYGHYELHARAIKEWRAQPGSAR